MKVVELDRLKATRRELDDVDTMMKVAIQAKKERQAEADGYMDAPYDQIIPIVDDMPWANSPDWHSIGMGLVVVGMLVAITLLMVFL